MLRSQLEQDIEHLSQIVYFYELAMAQIDDLDMTFDVFTVSYLDIPVEELDKSERLAINSRDGIERNLSNISEALNHLSSETRYALMADTSLEWVKLSDYRNHSGHEYPAVDFSISWAWLQSLSPYIDRVKRRLDELHEVFALGEYDDSHEL